jgi:hypothetical protein
MFEAHAVPQAADFRAAVEDLLEDPDEPETAGKYDEARGMKGYQRNPPGSSSRTAIIRIYGELPLC